MIKGIGIDICCISRLRKALKNPRFSERVYSSEELQYVLDRGGSPRHLASSFAAKEAFAKAGGWGIGRVGLRNVWLSRGDRGPTLCFSERARFLAESIGAKNAYVSVSHEGDFAIAVVILEG
ncbi:MAG: holo-ACP synthase [Thermovirga sp.]